MQFTNIQCVVTIISIIAVGINSATIPNVGKPLTPAVNNCTEDEFPCDEKCIPLNELCNDLEKCHYVNGQPTMICRRPKCPKYDVICRNELHPQYPKPIKPTTEITTTDITTTTEITTTTDITTTMETTTTPDITTISTPQKPDKSGNNGKESLQSQHYVFAFILLIANLYKILIHT